MKTGESFLQRLIVQKSLIILLLVSGIPFLSGVTPALGADLQSLEARFQSLLKEYTFAVEQQKPSAEVSRIGELVRQAKQAYNDALGGNGTQDSFSGSGFSGLSGMDYSAPEAADGVGSMAEASRSPEEKRFDELIAKIYSPSREKEGKELAKALQEFIDTVKNPLFVMKATFELAQLRFEIDGNPGAAGKILANYMKKAPTAEAVRLTQTRLSLMKLENRINAQRNRFDEIREACVSRWDQFSKTSWLAFPVKLFRGSGYLWQNLKRKQEAHRLSQLLGEYNQVLAESYPKGTLDEFTHSELIPSNAITLLINGRSSFRRRFDLARRARDKIWLQTLLYYDDETGNQLADILIERAQGGVDVRVISDDAFSFSRKSGIFRKLENGGVKVLINNPLLQHPLKANFRSHQKMFVVDDEVAIVGGMNIANDYAMGEIQEYGWRDNDVEARGPVVARISDLFESNWEALTLDKDWEKGQPEKKEVKKKQEKAPILPHRETLIPGPLPWYFSVPPAFSNVRVRFVKTFPITSKDDDILDLFTAYMKVCQKEVNFESAYFIPTPGLKKAIIDACKRGVKVKILTNSVESNNHPNAGYAGRANYEEVMNAGAEIYEWRGAQTLHSKVSWFDGFAVTLGAYNLNSRSNSLDSEDVIAIEDRRVSQLMKKVLDKDFSRARKVTFDDLNRWRSTFGERLKLDLFNTFRSIF